MLIVQFTSLLEEALLGVEGLHRLSGNVTDMDGFLSEDALAALEREHDGYFALLAFHPTADAAVRDYMREQTLPADSGSAALVLFTVQDQGVTSRPFSDQALAMLDVSDHELPVQAAMRHLFGPTVPALPGLAIFGSFCGEADVVYFSLAGMAGPTEVRALSRVVFGLANKAWSDCERDRTAFADAVALTAARGGVQFQRTGRRSMREWLVQTLRWLGVHRGDLVAVAGLAIGA